MTVIDLDRFGMMAFSEAELPEDLRAVVRDRFGGAIRAGVSLDRPAVSPDRAAGDARPTPVLGVARGNPDHYRIFPDAREIGPDFEAVGKRGAVVPAGAGWRRFVAELVALDDLAGLPGVEPPDPPDMDPEPTHAGAGPITTPSH